VNQCPAIFTKYNSLYKHVTRQHRDTYDVPRGNNTANRHEEIHQNRNGVNGFDSDVNITSSDEESDSDQGEGMATDHEDQVNNLYHVVARL
jgi:hypothetical protein